VSVAKLLDKFVEKFHIKGLKLESDEKIIPGKLILLFHGKSAFTVSVFLIL
jgi:hypothetical protein